MKITRIHLYKLHIPFRIPISHNLAERDRTSSLVAVAVSSTGIKGYGEGTPRQFVTGETLDSAYAAGLNLCGDLLQCEIASLDQLLALLREQGATILAQSFPSAWCALEIACLDLWARENGVPLWRLFQEQSAVESFTYSAVLPLLAPEAFVSMVELIRSFAMEFVKVKVGRGQADLDNIAIVRRHLGNKIDLRVDANGAFNAREALAFLDAAATYNIKVIEQPVPKSDLDGLAEITRSGGVDVLADESVCSVEDASRLARGKRCHGFNIRISKCGGLLNSLAIVAMAKRHGLFYQIGCHVGETAILSAAGRHLAAHCGDYRYLEGSFSRFVLAEDISEKDCTFGPGGKAALTASAGLGITIKEDIFFRYAHTH